MAKDKERSINPAQQQRKLEKTKALKKSRAELQTKRNEKLSKRNPERIQRQIDDLKALESSGDIKPREKAILADLERDLKAVHKAREALGDKAPARPAYTRDSGRDNANQTSLGKRRHDGQRKYDDNREPSGSDTDESVRKIPWPRDTPPPVPQEFRRNRDDQNANFGNRTYQAPVQPAVAKTTYESAPQVRDLKKEAVSKFVPNVVKRKQDALKGAGGQLLEPEELDRLEEEGYRRQRTAEAEQEETSTQHSVPKFSTYNPKTVDELQRLKAEEEAFEKEMAMHTDDGQGLDTAIVADSTTGPEHTKAERGSKRLPSRHVEIEEVEDEDL